MYGFLECLKRKILGTEGQELRNAEHFFTRPNGCNQLSDSHQDLAELRF